MAAVLGALLALLIPLSLQSVDRNGSPIPCGTSLHHRFELARAQDQISRDENHTKGPAFAISDYEAQCRALLSRRTTVAGQVGAAGAVGVLLACALAGRRVLRVRRRLTDTSAG